MDIKILGAGMAGMLAACKFPQAQVYDVSPAPTKGHRALLRFRDESVARLTGIQFKKVQVHKAVYYNGQLKDRASIREMNQYTKKATGSLLAGRSITDLRPVDRYIAPDDFYKILVDRVTSEGRMNWGVDAQEVVLVSEFTMQTRIVSTIPMAAILKICELQANPTVEVARKVYVYRYEMAPGTDLYQTIYFPSENILPFRASVTGNVLIIESMTKLLSWDSDLAMVMAAFGFNLDDIVRGVREESVITNGKMIDLPRDEREAILYELTRDFGVFSVGRFATHRNILLDDVVGDLDKVERLMNASDYAQRLRLATGGE